MGFLQCVTCGGRQCQDREQTATLQTALLHRARLRVPVRTQMRTARRDSIPIAWSLPIERHQGLVELARRRSDLFRTSSFSRLARKLVVQWIDTLGRVHTPAGLTPRWLASNASPRVITA